MNSKKTKQQRWEDGCRSDQVRNNFVIPAISEYVNELIPQNILYIGAGTGYIAKNVFKLIKPDVEWTLLDINSENISYLRENIPEAMSVNIIEGDFLKGKNDPADYDLVLIVFALLEMDLSTRFFEVLRQCTRKKKHVIIVMPDTLEDAIKKSATDAGVLSKFLNGDLKFKKEDSFTGELYPFHAHRFKDLAYEMTKSSFALINMKQKQVDNKNCIISLYKKM